MDFTQELKVLRLGKRPSMRFKTGEEDNSPVFLLRVLSAEEELEAQVNTQTYMNKKDIPEYLTSFIYETERVAIALKTGSGKRINVNGTELRSKHTEEEIGTIIGAYKGLMIHYKTIETITQDDLKRLVEGVHSGKPVESI
ncbi:hypothetical protein O0555_21620 [Brevibacillus laterosporus]|uniref:hypothetical protein n=1 Tax=Brevibacillus laterosporus TaxID=1465 RepID=UPI0018CF17D1|nr:hypothetical protein [Brevibacillus laterosporus]MBG9797132.1 hypothetical protein [Brevibacillus laterosporus]MCR8939904.1 hypothetical protein [Brevibacillus laterosporus]MCZ0842544.1 hypothetical protein [Brevibacillus laterosporus]MCZ0847572.1 hypothetical protein [Brevibacillus laterosporus]MED1909566.1 hypothetical protein [Brevibacillus laterosporus]